MENVTSETTEKNWIFVPEFNLHDKNSDYSFQIAYFVKVILQDILQNRRC